MKSAPLEKIFTLIFIFMFTCIGSIVVSADDECIWSEWIIDQKPTCTSVGHRYRTCLFDSNAPHTQEEIIPMLPHNYIITESNPTCVQIGIRTYKCEDCGYSYTEEYGEYKEHQYQSYVIKKADCYQKGETQYICTVCGDSYTELISELKHNYKETIVQEPTCTNSGIKKYECTYCNDSYTENFGSLKEHIFEEFVEENNDYKIVFKKCSLCEYTYEVSKEKVIIPIYNKNDNKDEEQNNSAITTVNAVMVSVDISAISIFTILIVPDLKVLRWYNKKKKLFFKIN